MSINTPNSLLAAQLISYNKGQETQSRESKDKKEQERLLNLQLQQARQQQVKQNTASAKQGVLA
jgi:hypothetical protein